VEDNQAQSGSMHPPPGELMQAFDGELGSGELVRVNAHVAHCQVCRADWARLQRATDLVAELHQAAGSIPLAALRLPAEKTNTPWILPFAKTWAISGVAALVCAAAWLSLRPASHSGQEPAAPAAATTTARSPVRAPSGSHSRVLQGELRAAKVNRPSHWRAVSAPPAAELISQAAKPALPATQPQTAQDVFWPLPYSNPALASQGGELIRVALPREAFVMAGVPLASIPVSGPSDKISADVWLGADGLPLAIRPASYRTTSFRR
jgi:hypothetical protein